MKTFDGPAQLQDIYLGGQNYFAEEINVSQQERLPRDSGKPRRQQIIFCDIQIKVVISHRQI